MRDPAARGRWSELTGVAGRTVAVVAAAGVAISLTALTGGMVVPASALPATTTTVAPAPAPGIPEPTYTPPPPPPVTHEAPPPPPVTHEAPPPTHEAPQTTYEAPQTTHEAPQTTQAPVTTQAPATQAPVTTTQAPPTTRAPERATTTVPAPATTTAAAPTTQARPTTATGPLPTATGPLPTTTGPVPTETRGLPTVTSSAAVNVPSSSGPTTALITTSGAKSPTPTTAVQAQKTTTPTETPKTLEATPQNIELARKSVPQVVDPPPQTQTDIRDLTINLNAKVGLDTNVAPRVAVEQKSQVKQWDRSWVHTDEFYRPVIINPYPQPLKVVYVYGGAPRYLMIPPLASAVTELAQIGVYNFTAMLLDAAGAATSVAVGTMYGGGYVPAPGEPPPPPPPPPVTYDDVPVQVQYSEATYQPFVVHQIVDAGMDPAVGEEKVLLDGVTPAWGVWQQNDNGDRMFVVHKTQQYPGMDDPPGEGPLPGDYPLQLASASKPASSGLSTKDLLLIGAACLVLVLGAGAIILNVVMGRRRQPRH